MDFILVNKKKSSEYPRKIRAWKHPEKSGCTTVLDRVPKEDAANFESAAFL